MFTDRRFRGGSGLLIATFGASYYSLRIATSIIITSCFSPYCLFQKTPASLLIVFAITAALPCGQPGGFTKIMQSVFTQQ